MEKVHDVVGLWLDPPDSAVVLCSDEKSQVQALARSSSWINQVERWFGVITDQLIRRGSH